jgi:hypothetical protein
MKFLNNTAAVLFLFFVGCGSDSGSNTGPTTTGTDALPNGKNLTRVTGDNVMDVTVNGSLCSAGSYMNKPCVSVKVCVPGTTNCQTVDDILLDTGSFGLRIFKSALGSLSFTYSKSGSATLAECAQFGSGSDWGPVAVASVVLANEPSVDVPIHIIDSTFGNAAANCSGADTGPSSAGFNGILGVGVFNADCGSVCASIAANKAYYACTGSTCTNVTVATTDQVRNPIAALPKDNNGLIVQFPSIDLGGVTSVNGYVVLGIGTRDNNQPGSVTMFPSNPKTGDFVTSFNGTTLTSFLDTGSNGMVFSASSSVLASCGSSLPGFFCPSAITSLSATNTGYKGSPSLKVGFQIGNALQLQTTTNSVFVELGENLNGFFDWGLPFHLGRNVYVGLEGTSSSLGDGPYVAY